MRMLPAYQGFGADEGTGIVIILRLEPDLELAFRQGVFHFFGHLLFVQQLLTHGFVIKSQAAFGVALQGNLGQHRPVNHQVHIQGRVVYHKDAQPESDLERNTQFPFFVPDRV